MASIDKRPNGRWRARWREYPGGPQRTRTFEKKSQAERFLVDVEHRILSGTYTPPEAGQVTVAEYAREWIGRRVWAPATHDRVERALRLHIVPALGSRPLASIRRAHVEEWARSLPLAPSSARTVVETFSAMLACAVDDERIPRNPAKGARLASPVVVPFVPLTVDQVRAVARAMPEHVRAAVVVAAGTGLRQGEMFGLSVDRVDFMRRELRVDRQLWTPARGAPMFRAPKSARSVRTVALSSVVVESLAAHMRAFGPGDDELVFHIGGGPVSRAMAAKYARVAPRSAGVTARWHDLRHHHASVLLSAGVSPALVAERLGHDLKTLLATYAHVIRSDEDRVRTVVDATLGDSAEDWLRTEGVG